VRLQDLAHELQVIRLSDADEDDRKIAGDAVSHSPDCPSVLFDKVSASARSDASEKKTREPSRSKELRLLDGDAEVPEGDLRVRVGKGEGRRATPGSWYFWARAPAATCRRRCLS